MKTSVTCLVTTIVLLFAGCGDEAAPTTAPATDAAATSPNGSAADSAVRATPGGSSAAGTTSAAHDTPQTVFADFKQAADNGDMETASALLTDESQSAFCLTMVIGSGFIAAFDPEAGTKIEDLFRKHGLDPSAEPDTDQADMSPQQAMLAMTAPIKDKPKFIGEVMALLDTLNQAPDENPIVKGTLEEVQIDGDSASGFVVTADGREPIEFVKVGGSWRIQLPEEILSMGGGDGDMSFSGDASFGEWSDNEFDNWQWDHFEEPQLGPPGEIPLDVYNTMWQVSVNETNVPAGELLRKLAAELSLEWIEPTEDLPQLSQPVSISVSGVSRLQAIEQIAEQADLHPQYLMKKMTVAAGPREFGPAFAGPFLVEVGEVDELVPSGAAQLTLRIHAHGLSESVVSLLSSLDTDQHAEENENFTIRITDRVGTGGKSLEHPGGNGFGLMPQHTETAIQWITPVALLNTTSDVADVEVLKGEITFVVPTSVETLSFETLEPGSKVNSGDATFELTSAEGDVEVAYTGADPENINVVARDADGNALESYGSSGYGDADGGSVSVFIQGEVASVDVVVTRHTERVRYPFEVRDIPLLRHEEQPGTIPDLTFDGDTPLAFEFVRFTKNEFDQDAAEVKFSNGSNRDITGYSVTLHYLDESGAELDDFPYSNFGEVVAAGDSTVGDLSTPFMPDGTKSVRVELVDVTFTDLTTWSADAP